MVRRCPDSGKTWHKDSGDARNVVETLGTSLETLGTSLEMSETLIMKASLPDYRKARGIAEPRGSADPTPCGGYAAPSCCGS